MDPGRTTGDREMLRAAEDLSRSHMQAYKDPSHDWLHVQRVRALSLKIAKSVSQSSDIDILVVELAALFHDLHDSKYAASTESIWDDLHERFFETHLAAGTISEERARLVCRICENVSYSKEVKRMKAGMQTPWHNECFELHCVQDADKLDAMGGIGIMRCAAFSAARQRPLLEVGNQEDAVSHFHDKLFKLESMMRTEEGQKMAESRHQTMLDFVASVESEWNDCVT